jgi:hypothetical protein
MPLVKSKDAGLIEKLCFVKIKRTCSKKYATNNVKCNAKKWENIFRVYVPNKRPHPEQINNS